MDFITRDGVRLAFESHGKGPAILLTHGYCDTSNLWHHQVKALSSSYQVIVWDMRGHGASDSPEDAKLYSQEASVLDMKAILDTCAVDKAVVGGSSLGGTLSLLFYLAYKHHTQGLVMLASGPGFKSDAAREAWNASANKTAGFLESKGLSAMNKVNKSNYKIVHHSAEGLAKAARGILTQHGDRVITSLPDITVPSLIMVGAQDTPFLGSADYMAKKIPGAKKKVIAEAGHCVCVDQPQQVNDALRDFLHAVH